MIDVLMEYTKLLRVYWAEMKAADVKGKYNGVFRTYSTTQRDVQMKYKQLFITINGLAQECGVTLKNVPKIVVHEERDEVLG